MTKAQKRKIARMISAMALLSFDLQGIPENACTQEEADDIVGQVHSIAEKIAASLPTNIGSVPDIIKYVTDTE